MKKSIIFVVVILALLVSMLPVSAAFAAKPIPTVKLTVINHTGGSVSISLISSSGQHYSFNVPDSGENRVAFLIPQPTKGSLFSFHAQTRCGLKVGIWNVSKNRFAVFACPKEGMDVKLVSPKTPPTLSAQ